MPLVKTFFIPTSGKPIIKNKSVKMPTGESKKGWFGGEKPVMRKEQQQEITGYSDSAVDGFALVQDMHEVINPWLEQGYELFSITPITSGSYKYDASGDYKYEYKASMIVQGTGSISGKGSTGYSYGFSYTEGIIVVLKKA
ncbi:hypothetical protein AXE65_04550 [Ventosimonas gracilis]|uniref:Uncharacterized protein n=1 Tax=Ventosimonas gracilis TaxID=1680762 RepID=A0A139SQB9_9GAMM|nr:hypothetical protein [Ventosimonas gracilis]KXU36766.1 hypothetical protein AXE65_04550 [Ventosimonas gracilis]